MKQINTSNLIYNDTPEVRLFSSEQFNWCLDKETGISCCWGKEAKQTPQYDPCGPQQLVWKITQFKLEEYINAFNFLTNIKEKTDNLIEDVKDINSKNLICMSTYGSIIFIIENLENINLEEFKIFIEYIKQFNIDPKIQLEYTNQLVNISEKILSLFNNIILSIHNPYKLEELLKYINKIIKEKNISLKVNVNKINKSDSYRLLKELDKNINVILYFVQPYLSTRSYLEFQTKCLNKEMTNVCISQCSKRHYSKDVIGSLLIELPCGFCRYSLYLENLNIYVCEKNKKLVGNLKDFNNIHDFWYSQNILNIRKSLIDSNKC